MKLLRTFDEPTDIVIIGGQVKDSCTFCITDDYSTLWIKGKLDEGYGDSIETEGYVTILTLEEFKSQYLDEEFITEDLKDNDCDTYFAVVSNYKGGLYLSLREEDSYKDITPEDLNLEEYVMYQNDEDIVIEDVALIFDNHLEGHLYNWEQLMTFLKVNEKDYHLDYFIRVNQAESKEHLKELLEVISVDGVIKGRVKEFDLDKTIRAIDAFFDEGYPPNVITREYGLRQQAMYLKFYIDRKKENQERLAKYLAEDNEL